MRLQVYLSHNGVCSRRKAMDVVKQGRVKVNGGLVREPSAPVNPAKDKVEVDNKLVSRKSYDYILLNKPCGCVTTKEDRFARNTVLDLLPEGLRHVHPAGRLDKDTEGLLLMTNDGDLTLKLTHPRFTIDKTYLVRINGFLNEKEQLVLQRGVVVEGRKTVPAQIREVKVFRDATQFFITIHEGKKRQIRLMMNAVEHKVIYLKRVRQGPLDLGDLPRGKWRRLTVREIERLKKI